jgi:SET domain-containing protein
MYILSSRQVINRRNIYFDATKKGNISSCINHSCNPNCIMEEWIVEEKPRMLLFTKKNIIQGEELTFDYGPEPGFIKDCRCGSVYCRRTK